MEQLILNSHNPHTWSQTWQSHQGHTDRGTRSQGRTEDAQGTGIFFSPFSLFCPCLGWSSSASTITHPTGTKPGKATALESHRRGRGEHRGYPGEAGIFFSLFPFSLPPALAAAEALLSHNGCQNTARQGIITDTYCGHYTTSTGCAK